MKNRKLLLIVSLVLALTMSLGGTLAYLQDSDVDVNVMTLGNVQIEQHEYQRVEKDGKFETDTIDEKTSYVLEVFEQNKPLLPIVGDPSLPGNDPGYAGWDSTPVRMSQVDSYGGMDVFAGKNAVDKFVTVENTGKTDAYVRTIVAVEVGSTDGSLVGTSYHGAWTQNEIGKVTINGNGYIVFEYIYAGAQLSDGSYRHEKGILPAGDTTYPNLAQVYLKAVANNDDMVAIDGNQDGMLNVLVVSQAVQAAGFTDAKTALDTAFGVVALDSHPWIDWEDPEDEKDQDPDFESTADEMIKALENGEDVSLSADIIIDPAGMSNAYGTTGINVKNGQTIDGNGFTLDTKGAGGTWDSCINTTGGLIKNITVTGSFRGIFINHNSDHSEPVVLENVTIEGTTYTISCDQGTGEGLTATNSTFNGWTSYAATLGEAKFVNCNFGKGNGYAFCRPYAPTEFVGCAFEAGYKVDPVAAVTFENCTIGGVDLTADNLADLVTKTSNATVK